MGNRAEGRDADLVRAARAGEAEAFGVLVDRYLGDVYAVAVRIVCHRAEAEDAAQDAFVRAFERLEQYQMQYPFRNWLLRIAANVAINRLRSRRREKKLQLKIAGDMERNARAGERPEETPGAHEWMYWLDQLEDPQRAAIVLFHFHEMSYTDIAETLELPLNTIRTHIHRGRKRLRELMTAEVPGENRAWTVAL